MKILKIYDTDPTFVAILEHLQIILAQGVNPKYYNKLTGIVVEHKGVHYDYSHTKGVITIHKV